ncbi:hypothetical protein BCR34DRAFT_345582 [Clohesyomyces aquaticus]|uniref:Uncharacterized protein n=1 Tax=Clohesyomyces aquaticus TaxID=1231657 RepID=A0A1Y1ZKA1_9PLEO|nr:hypothetical protein BCR34DRAFT_345582 [Clohesyomyces aquaticus]
MGFQLQQQQPQQQLQPRRRRGVCLVNNRHHSLKCWAAGRQVTQILCMYTLAFVKVRLVIRKQHRDPPMGNFSLPPCRGISSRGGAEDESLSSSPRGSKGAIQPATKATIRAGVLCMFDYAGAEQPPLTARHMMFWGFNSISPCCTPVDEIVDGWSIRPYRLRPPEPGKEFSPNPRLIFFPSLQTRPTSL